MSISIYKKSNKVSLLLIATILLIVSCNQSSNNYLPKENLQTVERFAEENDWRVYDENPVIKGDDGFWDAGALGSMSVLNVNDTIHLYYESLGARGEGWDHSNYVSLQIGHATSVDGIHWAKDKQNPVIPKGKECAVDHEGTWDPFVLFEDGIYKMWYGGGEKPNEIGYATSIDGSNFTKRKQLSTDLNDVEDMHAVHDFKSGKYFMYYWHRAAKGGVTLVRVESNSETDFGFENPSKIIIEGEVYLG